ncbi:hypothetical protein AMECASPLE_027014 [Ameca splendens]|uniref:Uncharacterized protein n=1 Tax=Ameca splendens TaxID=208324 RepID=A0ABV0Z2Y9_9TELE
MRQRSTLPYISLALTPWGLAPPLGRADVRINLTFTQTSRLLCSERSCAEPASVPGPGKETKHLSFRHISSLACQCSGDDQQDGAERKVEAIVRSDVSSPQKDKSILNFFYNKP